MSDYREFLEDDEDIMADVQPIEQPKRRRRSARIVDDGSDKNKPVYRMPGRPPKSPKNLVRTPVRCLTTIGTRQAIEQGGEIHAVTISNYLRLALYRQLEADGLMTPKLRKDATWDELRQAGLV
ncbi:MAG: hypothetical protein GX491_06815 [Chloroflexi bacterium]|nr:hypothetical protein [Chloroflexota bacterium]